MIVIDEKKCVGCGRCVEICPGNLLTLSNSRAKIRDVRDCWGCTACVKTCPVDAICYQLAADLGGAGAKLFAKDSPTTLSWQIKKADGDTITLDLEKNRANQF